MSKLSLRSIVHWFTSWLRPLVFCQIESSQISDNWRHIWKVVEGWGNRPALLMSLRYHFLNCVDKIMLWSLIRFIDLIWLRIVSLTILILWDLLHVKTTYLLLWWFDHVISTRNIFQQFIFHIARSPQLIHFRMELVQIFVRPLHFNGLFRSALQNYLPLFSIRCNDRIRNFGRRGLFELHLEEIALLFGWTRVKFVNHQLFDAVNSEKGSIWRPICFLT